MRRWLAPGGAGLAWAVVLACGPCAQAQDFARALQRARTVLEARLGQRLEVRLELRKLSTAEERSLRRADLRFEPLAVYDRKNGALVLDPDACRARLAGVAESRREADALAFLLFVHELAHVYQEPFSDRGPGARLPGRWLRFLREGHAVWLTGEIARQEGLQRLHPKVPEAPPEPAFVGRLGADRAQLAAQFFYGLSRRYVAARCRRPQDFRKLLAAPPDYPAVLGVARPRRTPDRRVGELVEAAWRKLPRAQKLLPVDFYDAASALCPPAFFNRRLCRSYQGGWASALALAGDEGLDWLVLEFAEGAERDMAETFRRYARSASFVPRKAGACRNCGAYAGYPGPGQTLHLRVAPGFVAVAVAPDSARGARAAQRVLEALERKGR
jgi:hypothetical protein